MKRKDCPYFYKNIRQDKLFIACIPLAKTCCKTCTRHDGWVDEPTVEIVLPEKAFNKNK